MTATSIYPCCLVAAAYPAAASFSRSNTARSAALTSMQNSLPAGSANTTQPRPKAGSTQACMRSVPDAIQIRAVAGHMHMLGKSIQVDVVRRDGASQRLLDVKVWNFDDQRATVLPKLVTMHPADQLKVTCTHDATLRQRLPALAKLPPRYVVWGEGSSDEMCLGIINYTQ